MRCDQCGIVTLNIDYSELYEREKLIELFTLCSSKEIRDSIQGSNPEIDINSEIVINWKEVFYQIMMILKNNLRVMNLACLGLLIN